jgi:tRNA(Ile)-lysidine synthase
MPSPYPEKPPWTPLHARIHRVLRQRSLLHPNQRLLIAVSGGQDSLCLAKLLLDLQPKWSWHLAIAHCNHRWRSDSTANAEYVEQLAQTWQIPFYCQTVEESLIASIQSEAGAREWRYHALVEIAQEFGFSGIVTGHTASDRAETLLYNLTRGSGADGLQALTWKRSLPNHLQLVRPLLTTTRSETGQFCQEFALQPWLDSTNDDLKYARNRIRQELLPYLQQHFNPQIELTLAQTAELLTADVAYLEAEADQLYQQATKLGDTAPHSTPPSPVLSSPSPIALDRALLRTTPLALQRRVIRRFLQQALPQAPDFEHIEKLVSLIDAPNRTQTDPFPGGTIAKVNGNHIWMVSKDQA